MDFITGALPNVMFIAGLIAMGIGLGIEFKIVEIKGELSKQGRIGAIGIGAALVLVSIYLYSRPPQTATAPATVQPSVVQANLGAVVSASQPSPTQAAQAQAAATAVPPTPTVVPPTATNVPPTATAVPPTATNVPPTATAVPPTATTIPPSAVPSVKVPDIRGKNTKDAKKALEALGLRLGEQRDRCEDIGALDESQRKLKKDQIRCQSPAPGADAALNTTVLYVLGGGDDDD
jgi:hypothetical protein